MVLAADSGMQMHWLGSLRAVVDSVVLSTCSSTTCCIPNTSLATLWPWWLSRVAEQNFYWEGEREACLPVIHFCAAPPTLSLHPDDFNAFLNSF